MIHEAVCADNHARAEELRLRTPHAKGHDEPNHRTQVSPCQTGRDRNPFARITRVSAIAPNLVRVIRRLRPTDVGADERVSPTADFVSHAPRKRRALSVVKCSSACLGVKGSHVSSPLRPSHADRLRAAALGAPPLRFRRTRQDGSRHARRRTIRTGSSAIACATEQTAQAASYVIRLRSTRSAIFAVGIPIAHWSFRYS